jgi:uncharacterized phage infection (PIP) family protein YhgE
MVFSALGLVISLLGLGAVCRFSGPVAASADEALEVAVAALSSTKQNLDLADRALGEAQIALGAMQDLVEGAGEGMENTSALVGSVGDILLRDLPDVIEESQLSLAAAEEGAAVIEELLYGLNAVSRLTGVTYDPDVSLTEGFARMNESLEALPESLAELDGSLNAVQENLDDLQTTFTELTGPLSESQAVLSEAQSSVEAYSGTIEQLTFRVINLRESLPNWIRITVVSLYFLLIWLAVSQMGLLWQGWEMLSHHPRLLEDRVRELEEKVEELAMHSRE